MHTSSILAKNLINQMAESSKKKNKAKEEESDELAAEIAKMKEMFPRPPLRGKNSQLVYMGNIRSSLKKREVEIFFKDAGEIEWIKLHNDFGHVRFCTHEAAKKATELNGKELSGRPVDIWESEEWTFFDDLKPSEKHIYLYMGNLSASIKEKHIVEFFKGVGEVVSIHLIREDEPYNGYGYNAHVQFSSSKVAHKAVRLHGKMLIDRDVVLYLATKETVWDYTYKIRGYGICQRSMELF